MPNITKNFLRGEVGKVNDASESSLSSRKLYSSVSKILTKDPALQQGLFVELYKRLASDIFKNASHKRTLVYHGGVWADDYGNEFAQFTIDKAMKDAKNLVNICHQLIDSEGAKSFQLSRESLEELKNWQLDQLKVRTEYAETVGMVGDWSKRAANSLLSEAEKDLGLNGPAREDYTYTGDFNKDKDSVIADIYCKVHALREEVNRHNVLWRWFFAGAHNHYIKRATEILKSFGFNEELHGKTVIDRAKSRLFQPYDVDVDHVKQTFEEEISRTNQKQSEASSEVSREARDYRAKADELNKNPETSFESKLLPYTEKYGIGLDKLNKSYANWNTVASDFDRTKDVQPLGAAAERILVGTLRELMSNALKTNQQINVKQMLRDARQIAVMSLKFNTLAYDLQEVKDAKLPPYLPNVTADFIKGRMPIFMKGASTELINQVADEAAEEVALWHADPDSVKREDETFAERHAHPAQKSDDGAVKVGDSGREPCPITIEEPRNTQLSPPHTSEPTNVISAPSKG